ncbi:hypothetical protein HD596_009251 [Nonomuraea jabiensis]|uniref:Uncharacterized protein n=1 Tax=Nonomuraea jabiensis TaxID=882448 RepID=A0A7W9GET0_9ACTN|nr:hypothetical protein [Nonomuraea jabiensis]MBB5782495.1 hypothetical protein [Nonomuraea jabiensis]
MNDGTLVYDGADPSGEGTREALRTPGNGRFATPGCEWFRPERAALPAYRHELDLRHDVLGAGCGLACWCAGCGWIRCRPAGSGCCRCRSATTDAGSSSTPTAARHA